MLRPELDLAGAGADRLALQEKQDEASVAAVGQAERLSCAVYAALRQVRLWPSRLQVSSLCGLCGRLVRAKPL